MKLSGKSEGGFPSRSVNGFRELGKKSGLCFSTVRGRTGVSISVHGLNFPPLPKGAHSSYHSEQMWD